jgi:hypothetical protein
MGVSKVNKYEKGFPLIHVNKKFEEMTLYSKSDCIGRGGGFLQRRKTSESSTFGNEPFTESVSIAKMSQALANAQPVRVLVSDFKKDGSPFTNLLFMKPILDQHGKCFFHYFLAVDSKLTIFLDCRYLFLRGVDGV